MSQASARKKIKQLEERDWVSVLVTIYRKNAENKQYGQMYFLPSGKLDVKWISSQIASAFKDIK